VSLADRYTARQSADGTWTVRVTRRYLAGLGYRDETRTYVTANRPASPGAAWAEAERIARQHERRCGRRAMRKRRELTVGLVSVPCPECGARPGKGCDYDHLPAREMIRLEKDPLLVVHTTRMADAVTAGKVNRAQVLAQFDGPPSAALGVHRVLDQPALQDSAGDNAMPLKRVGMRRIRKIAAMLVIGAGLIAAGVGLGFWATAVDAPCRRPYAECVGSGHAGTEFGALALYVLAAVAGLAGLALLAGSLVALFSKRH
jgi:hypothetical protein